MKLTRSAVLSVLLNYGKELCPLANLTGPCSDSWIIQYGTGPLAMAYGHFVKPEELCNWRSLHQAMDTLYANWLKLFEHNTLPFSHAYCQGIGLSPLQRFWDSGAEHTVPREIYATKRAIRYQLGILLVGNTDHKESSHAQTEAARGELKRLVQYLLDLMRIRREGKLIRLRQEEKEEKPVHFLIFQRLKMLLHEQGLYALEETTEEGGTCTLFYIELKEPNGILERYMPPFSILTERNWAHNDLYTFTVEMDGVPFYRGNQKVGAKQLTLIVDDILEALYFVDILKHLNTVRYF